MKNIHVIPTDKPSRLHKIGNELGLTNEPNSNFLAKQQNIYITSLEEIKDGDWVLSFLDDESYETPFQIEENHFNCGFDFKEDFKKIILTTDPKLIEDGVQAIDDEFLEWFVKNPSCEEVKTQLKLPWESSKDEYEIIIPKEESRQECEHIKEYGCIKDVCSCNTGKPKQEILEEAAEKYYNNYNKRKVEFAFIDGAKWQQERSYSKEEVWKLVNKLNETLNIGSDLTLEKWFEQFKKK